MPEYELLHIMESYRLQSKEEVLSAVAFRRAGGRTNTQAALTLMTSAFAPTSGDRVGADNIAIVVTDGR